MQSEKQQAKETLLAEADSKRFKSKPMVMVKNPYIDDFLKACGKRGWLKPQYELFTTQCNHQAHNGYIGKEHGHFIVDIGTTSKRAFSMYLQRNIPKAEENRFRTVWPTSMNHHLNQMIYIRTKKHGHENPLWTRNESKEVKFKLREIYPYLHKEHKKETKRFLKLIENAKCTN